MQVATSTATHHLSTLLVASVCATAVCASACTSVSSHPGICDAPSPVSALRPELTDLRQEADYAGIVESLESVPAAVRDECWYTSMSGALRDVWDLPRAEEELEAGLDAFPESPSLILALANTYALMGRLAESEALLLDALTNEPPREMSRWLRDGLARTHRAMGDYQAAQSAWDQMLREDPTDVSFILNSMSVEAILGHYEEARDRNDRAVLLGVSEYGRSVGLSNLASAAYYGGEEAEAKGYVDVLLHQAEPIFSGGIATLSLMLDHRVEEAHDRVQRLHEGRLTLPLRVAKAGLQAKLGDTSELDEVTGPWPGYEPPIRLALVHTLLALRDPTAVDVAQSLVESVPDNPLYQHLLGRALRDANQVGWEEHAEAAARACPDNVVFEQASTAPDDS